MPSASRAKFLMRAPGSWTNSRPADCSNAYLSTGTRTFVKRAVECDEPVLLLGETGSGKSRLAAIIHSTSARARAPLVSVNCGAVPETLFEREMFGHERGAFTDASEAQRGLFEAAHGGTLVLDEIGDLPVAMQVKLLDVLDSGSVRRIGSTRRSSVDVRIIAATNADLNTLIENRRFRKDLYYRISVLQYTMLPLRHCRDELEAIVRAGLVSISNGTTRLDISSEAMETIRRHSWPGNLRELLNALRYAQACCSGSTIRTEHLPPPVRTPTPERSMDTGDQHRYTAPVEPQCERELIRAAIDAAKGNRTAAARQLGMCRSTLWLKAKLYGLDTCRSSGM